MAGGSKFEMEFPPRVFSRPNSRARLENRNSPASQRSLAQPARKFEIRGDRSLAGLPFSFLLTYIIIACGSLSKDARPASATLSKQSPMRKVDCVIRYRQKRHFSGSARLAAASPARVARGGHWEFRTSSQPASLETRAASKFEPASQARSLARSLALEIARGPSLEIRASLARSLTGRRIFEIPFSGSHFLARSLAAPAH